MHAYTELDAEGYVEEAESDDILRHGWMRPIVGGQRELWFRISVGASDRIWCDLRRSLVKNCAATRHEVTVHSDTVMVTVPTFVL